MRDTLETGLNVNRAVFDNMATVRNACDYLEQRAKMARAMGLDKLADGLCDVSAVLLESAENVRTAWAEDAHTNARAATAEIGEVFKALLDKKDKANA